MKDRIETFREIQNSKNEKNCCTVVASALAFNVPFKEVQKIYSRNGRKKNKGLTPPDTDRMILKMGSLCNTPVNRVEAYQGMTINNFSDYYPYGSFIVGIRGHVACIIDGVTEDWTEDRKHRINRVWQIGEVKRLTFENLDF